MISIVLYGRNDNYGYNLHKRAALSLNCMAEVLTDDADEILFVDYNTPNDFPTFPEAIVDTLTPQAVRKLRVLRVRPEAHDTYFGDRTHLKALEPVSRNVAVRRSNPQNRWILSTNTDMIFVPRQGASLSDAVRNLPQGFYCTPRFEIPETLWESFNRLDPRGVIEQTRDFGEALHLNEIVMGAETILYDAPGDFQLFERQDMFDYHGFDEEMLLGWHVDSNISKRFFCRYGAVGDALPHVFGYHCDHTRQVTPMHRHKSAQNDIKRFIDDITGPELPHQADSWGLADVDIEEVSLSAPVSGMYRAALTQVMGARQTEPTVSRYAADRFDKEGADPKHILPFLLDIFASAKRDTWIGWIGETDALFDVFTKALQHLGFEHPVQAIAASADTTEALDTPEIFIVNFGVPDLVTGDQERALRAKFWDLLVCEEQRKSRALDPRRIIAINAIHNRFEPLVSETIVVAKTPFSTRLRQGFVDPGIFRDHFDWTDGMQVGQEGAVDGDHIVSTADFGGIAYGPYGTLIPGDYTARLEIVRCEPASADAAHGHLEIELLRGDVCESVALIAAPCQDVSVAIPISVTSANAERPLQFRVMNFGVHASVGTVTVDRGHDAGAIQATRTLGQAALRCKNPEGPGDWTAHMRIGSQGAVSSDEIISTEAQGTVAFGPYGRLPVGHYTARLALDCMPLSGRAAGYLELEVLMGDAVAQMIRIPAPLQAVTCAVPLDVNVDRVAELIQFRVKTVDVQVRLGSVIVQAGTDADAEAIAETRARHIEAFEPEPERDVAPLAKPKPKLPLSQKLKREVRRIFK